MTFGITIFGTETRADVLVRSLVGVTLLRAGWYLLNSNPDLSGLSFVLMPWPLFYWTWTVWLIDLLLVLYQARSALRLGRLLLLKFAPAVASRLGVSQYSAQLEQPRPRNRSWLPTAFMFSLVIILTCTMGWWGILMIYYGGWAPFDGYLSSPYGYWAFLVGAALSVLGFFFGGTYIAQASGHVGNSFGVTTVADDHWLAQRVHRYAEQLGLPKPGVGITKVTNAFAMGANQKSAVIVIGSPLFNLQEDELDAIIGHELGHVLHNDVARMQFAEGFQRMLVQIVNLLTVFGMIIAAQSSKSRSSQTNVQLAMHTGRLVRGTVFIGSELVAKGISRNREYYADAIGAHVTSPDAMARALKRVHGFGEAPTPEERHYGYLMFRGSRFGNFFATHPTLDARLRALSVNASLERSQNPSPTEVFDGSSPASRCAVAPLASPPPSGTLRDAFSDPAITKAFTLARRLPLKKVAAWAVVVLLGLALVPAVISYYRLEDRAASGSAAVASFASSSWKWASEHSFALKEAIIGPSTDALRITQLEVENNQLKEKVAELGGDAGATATKTTQLQSRISDLQEELARLRSIEKSRSVERSKSAASDVNESLQGTDGTLQSNVRQLQADLRQSELDLQTLKIDRAQILARAEEQEAMIGRLRDENDRLQTEDTTSSGNTVAELQARIRSLDERAAAQSKTIAEWAVDRTASFQKIRDLEKQLALKDVAIASAPSQPLEQWVAAAVTPGGSVEVVTSQPSQSQAASAVMRKCRRKGGQCQLLGVERDQCVSVARPRQQRIMPGNFWEDFSSSRDASARNARGKCDRNSGGQCEVAFSYCASDPSSL